MLELRDYYAQQVVKYESLYRQALDNLNHVEALLSSWSSSTDGTSNFSSKEMTPSDCTTQYQDALAHGESISTDEPEVNTTEPKTEVNEDASTSSVPENLTTSREDNITQLSLNWVKPIDSQVPQILNVESEDHNSVDADQQSPLPANETEIATEANSLFYSEILMLPEYQSLTRTEAIQKLLQENVGTVSHIDFIVRSLYGELEPDLFKVVKGRVQSTLTHGKETNKWSLIPGQPGCYTLVLSLVNSNPTGGSSQKGKNKNRKPSPQAQTNIVPMLSPYQGQFLIDALTSFFQQNPGKVFNVAEVIATLYGELNGEELREIKPKVLNELSRGHRIGRFSRVPQEIGLYTWDAKLLQSKDPS